MDNIEQVQAIANVRKFIDVLKEQDDEKVDRKYVIKTLTSALSDIKRQIIPLDGIEICTDKDMTFLIGEIHTTYQRLVEIFGEPHQGKSGDGKVQVEWCFIFEDTGDVFTIYDWKEYDTKPEYVTEWHIGGRDHKTFERVEEYFDEKSSLLSQE